MKLVNYKTDKGTSFKIVTNEVTITLASLYNNLLNAGLVSYSERKKIMNRTYESQFNFIQSLFVDDNDFNNFYNSDVKIF